MRRSAFRDRSCVGDLGVWRPVYVPSGLTLQKEKSALVEKLSFQTEKSLPVEEFDPEKENGDCSRCVNGSICGVVSQAVDTDGTNLDRFLRVVSPVVHARRCKKKISKQWEKDAARIFHYYVLEELWESFQEWSAYGAGAPLLMNGSESIVQYYVPYLSGIQLYLDPSSSSSAARDQQESQCIRVQDRCCKEMTQNQNTIPPGPGIISFQYFETVAPYMREPLTDKIEVLASKFPELKTYRSCDLSPSSWLSVAWYPIYRIPAGSTLKNLDACFLTFHSLSTRCELLSFESSSCPWLEGRPILTSGCSKDKFACVWPGLPQV